MPRHEGVCSMATEERCKYCSIVLYMETSYYRINSDSYTYYAKVQVYSDMLHKVFIGGKKKCVVISVYFDGTHPNIDTFAYDPKCDVHATLQRGKGSVDLLQSAMLFVKRLYKHSTFELIDQSHVTCAKGYQIPLVHLHIVKYFKTWYEDKLGAIPVQLPTYQTDMRNLRSYMKTYPSFDDFANKCGMSPVQKSGLAELYNQCKTVQEFIKKITSEYDCYLCKGWVSKLVQEFMSVYGSSWLLRCNTSRVLQVSKVRSPPTDAFFFSAQGGAALDEAMSAWSL